MFGHKMIEKERKNERQKLKKQQFSPTNKDSFFFFFPGNKLTFSLLYVQKKRKEAEEYQ